jgi:hypothetical protein
METLFILIGLPFMDIKWSRNVRHFQPFVAIIDPHLNGRHLTLGEHQRSDVCRVGDPMPGLYVGHRVQRVLRVCHQNNGPFVELEVDEREEPVIYGSQTDCTQIFPVGQFQLQITGRLRGIHVIHEPSHCMIMTAKVWTAIIDTNLSLKLNSKVLLQLMDSLNEFPESRAGHSDG